MTTSTGDSPHTHLCAYAEQAWHVDSRVCLCACGERFDATGRPVAAGARGEGS